MDLKSGAMQALKLSTLMVSLQAVLLDQVKKDPWALPIGESQIDMVWHPV